MAKVEYPSKNKRVVYGLFHFEKTILDAIFIKYGDLERSYSEIKEMVKRKFRLKNRDFIELIDNLINSGYIEKIGNKRSMYLRVKKCLK